MFVSSRSYFNFKSTDQIYYTVDLIWRPGRGCLSGGPHFNPYGKIRGTLGNIQSDQSDIGEFSVSENLTYLYEPTVTIARELGNLTLVICVAHKVSTVSCSFCTHLVLFNEHWLLNLNSISRSSIHNIVIVSLYDTGCDLKYPIIGTKYIFRQL